MTAEPPLIITLKPDPDSQAYFNQLREAHFPAELNFLRAHLTLFHNLPYRKLESVSKQLRELARQSPEFNLQLEPPKNIGRGVAYPLRSPELLRLHRYLQQLWLADLNPQDRQKLWPHVTVQNKVAPELARALLNDLSGSFTPFRVQAKGFQLFTYQGGPWQWVEDFPFSA